RFVSTKTFLLYSEFVNYSTFPAFHMAVNRLNDLLLLRRLHADGLERLPGAAVRADERFVVLSGNRRSAVVGPAAKRADRHPNHIILHIRIPPCICCKRQPECFCQSRRYHILPGKSSCRNYSECQSACPHA